MCVAHPFLRVSFTGSAPKQFFQALKVKALTVVELGSLSGLLKKSVFARDVLHHEANTTRAGKAQVIRSRVTYKSSLGGNL